MNEFIRHSPPVYPGGDISPDYQTTGSWTARWSTEFNMPVLDLAGAAGTLVTWRAERLATAERLFLVVTRSYYCADIDDMPHIKPGEFTECHNEYTLCLDPDNPGDTEINTWYDVERVSDQAATDDELETLAYGAAEPTWQEWNEMIEEEGPDGLLITAS
jgi:hypothetical protein